jgi:hypothetical protein
MSLFTRKAVKPMSSTPSSEDITKTRLSYGRASENATANRAQASMLTTASAAGVGSVWAATAGISAARLVAASAVGASVVVPPLAPAAIGVMVACIFIMRQKGLNKELLSNLYFIKMEVERMSRIHNVLKEIAKENHINLNTASLSLIMVALQKKILLFADAKTKKDIEQLESFLKHDKIAEAKELTDEADEQSDLIMKNSADLNSGSLNKKSGGAWLPTGWSSRWLSPDETLRQIIRDITIANVWFSIMLGEFDIFMRFTDVKTTGWKESKAMKELLLANRQLGTTTAVNKSTDADFDLFYSILDMKEASRGILLTLREPVTNTKMESKGGKTRRARRRARRH